MIAFPRRLAILGIGSPHGDDQFGWAVIDYLAGSGLEEVELQKLTQPVDVISELSNDQQVILVDAAMGLLTHTGYLKLSLINPADRQMIQELPVRGTHDFGLHSVFMLADKLGKPMHHVSIWLGAGHQFERFHSMTAKVQRAVAGCAEDILSEVRAARSVADCRQPIINPSL